MIRKKRFTNSILVLLILILLAIFIIILPINFAAVVCEICGEEIDPDDEDGLCDACAAAAAAEEDDDFDPWDDDWDDWWDDEVEEQTYYYCGGTFSSQYMWWIPPCLNYQQSIEDTVAGGGFPAPEVNYICGNDNVGGDEECESPSTKNNPFCRQTEQACNNTMTLLRSPYGNCRDDCMCIITNYNSSCVKDSCGAGCGIDSDCAAYETCDQASCQCVSTSAYCGDGIVNGAEECDFAGEQITEETKNCVYKQTCNECKLNNVLDKSNSTFETCDGIDNDCNGITDDYNISSCQNEDAYCSNRLGVCKLAEKTCMGSSGFSDCTTAEYNFSGFYETDETRCDGYDNDCDGSRDEGCECVPGKTMPCGYDSIDGPCNYGYQTCDVDGTWGTCFGAIYPSSNSETACDGIDNDCDGVADECVTNNCDECGQIPDEICNYRDDNCNSEPEGPQSADYDPETKTYVNFSNYCPAGEICKGTYADGIDNNNDNITDENIDENVKALPEGNYTSWCALECILNTEETDCTDGVDNDCDGLMDCNDPDCAGIVQGTVIDTNNDEVEFADINIFQGTQVKHSTFTNTLGFYNISNVLCGAYDITASASEYVTETKSNAYIEPKNTTTVNFTGESGSALVPGTTCEGDCTYAGDNTAHKECSGINGCNFYDSIAMEVCDLAQPGWIRDYSDGKVIECAEGSPVNKVSVKATVTCEKENIIMMTKLAKYKGKLVKIVVAVCG